MLTPVAGAFTRARTAHFPPADPVASSTTIVIFMPPVEQLWVCGSLPGHARAFLSLSRQWKTWVTARARYSAIEMPVTLVYGDHDWSRPEDREANRQSLPAARTLSLETSGHFSCLERPQEVAGIIREDVSRVDAA